MSKITVFLAIFAIVSVTHVVSIFLRKEKLRQISKIFIIPPLLAAYIASGAGETLFFPIPALVFGWIGDMLLLRIVRKNWFKLGLVSFLLGHLCYIITFTRFLGFFGADGSLNVTALLVSVPLALVLGIASFRFIKPSREMAFPVIIYTTFLLSINLLALQVLIFNPDSAGVLVFLGCLFFLVSDIILAYYTFRKLKLPGAALIMIFYITAQAGIILGLIYIV